MNSIVISLALIIVGAGIVFFFAERLVKGVVGLSLALGISAFVISVVLIGFDPENLAVGAVAAVNGVSGIALGTIIGSAMVAIGLAFGITAVIAPMKFERAPWQVLSVPIAAILLLGILASDGLLSRLDGTILLIGFVLTILLLFQLSKRGLDIKATGEVAETLEKTQEISRWRSIAEVMISLAAIVAGSEMLVHGSKTLIIHFGMTDTVFGMTILAFLISIEELARELPAAMKGRSEISFGNVAGSVLAFFLFNAGVVALVHPIPVDRQALGFYLPVCLLTMIVITLLMLKRSVPRWGGLILLLLYAGFISGGFFLP